MAKKKRPAAGRPKRTPGTAVPPRTPGATASAPSVRARAAVDDPWNATGRAAPALPPREVVHVKRAPRDDGEG